MPPSGKFWIRHCFCTETVDCTCKRKFCSPVTINEKVGFAFIWPFCFNQGGIKRTPCYLKRKSFASKRNALMGKTSKYRVQWKVRRRIKGKILYSMSIDVDPTGLLKGTLTYGSKIFNNVCLLHRLQYSGLGQFFLPKKILS